MYPKNRTTSACLVNRRLRGDRPVRDQKGNLGSVLLLALIPLVVAMAALAYDISHMVTVQSQLQTAVEAAALSGAQTLIDNPDNAEYHALEVCAENHADGEPVSNDVQQTTVTSLAKMPTVTDGGAVQVTAQRQVEHIYARIFGRYGDGVTATATAGPGAPIQDLGNNQAFPLVVSLDVVPNSGPGRGAGHGNGNNSDSSLGIDTTPMYLKQVGDNVNFYINSQVFKNAAFTSFQEQPANANYITTAMDMFLGLVEEIPGYVPALSVGDFVNLNNGIAGERHLVNDPRRSLLIQKQYIVVPVITGDPAYTQSREVVGFITVKVNSVTATQQGGVVQTISGTLVQGLAKGNGRNFPSTDPNATALNNISARAIRLLPDSEIY